MYGDCSISTEKKLEICSDKEETEVKWYEWVLKEQEYGQGEKSKKIKRMMKIAKPGTSWDLVETFNTEMKKFKTHVFNFYYQYNEYRSCKKNLTDKEVIIHIDFSENFTCKYLKEIQAMLFIKDQITLHTGVIYLKNLKDPISFCTISPSNEHGPEAIWSHLDPILKYTKSDFPNTHLYLALFSDRPTTQYR